MSDISKILAKEATNMLRSIIKSELRRMVKNAVEYGLDKYRASKEIKVKRHCSLCKKPMPAETPSDVTQCSQLLTGQASGFSAQCNNPPCQTKGTLTSETENRD